MSRVEIRGVSKSFGATRVLDAVALDVPAGQLTAVLGPSGCGKTTLLRLIAGFARVDAGTITLDGMTVCGSGRHVPAQRRRVGYVAQEGALFPHLDVATNVGFGLPRRARRANRARDRVDEMLELVGLDRSYRGRFPHELSGGQQQRVALARALAPRPSIILLDEPFASLDTRLRHSTGRAVADALAAAGATAVLVTHDQSEALSLADQVAVMRDGRIVQADAPDRVYHAPVDTAVAAFVGGAVVLPARIDEAAAVCALGTLDVAPAFAEGADVDVLIRPEQIEIRPAEADGVAARVAEVSYFGHDAAVRLDILDDGTRVLARVSGAAVPVTGSVVRLVVRGPVGVYARGEADPRLAPPAAPDAPPQHETQAPADTLAG
jgi:iron(III) transport system ATP-binding protein